jgi:ADP-L-glycero-D-manno-heptose 6-epimerase
MSWLALTGVNGFIGHNLALELLFPNGETYAPAVESVLGTDLPSSEGRQTHARLAGLKNYHYASGIGSVAAIEERTVAWGGPPLAVIHNGACSSTTVHDASVFRIQNVESSQLLFRYCAEKRIPFLYASSASVYGAGAQGFSDAIEDNDLYTPMNMYGQSKLEFDSWVLRQKARPPVWFGMRYFNVVGPFEEHKQGQASIFTWGRKQILETGKLRLFQSHRDGLADGHQKRDFVCVHDVCRVTWQLLGLALSKPEFSERGLFVNVGRGEAVTWLDIGAALFDALGVHTAFEFIPMPESLRQHYQNFTEASLETLHKLDVRQPFLGLRQGFERSLQVEARAAGELAGNDKG